MDDELDYYGDLPDVGGPAANSSRAPARGGSEPTASVAAVLGESLGEVKSQTRATKEKLSETREEIKELHDQIRDVLTRLEEETKARKRAESHIQDLTAMVTTLAQAHQGVPSEEVPPPADLAQVPASERSSWIAARARWVREVLFVNYGEDAEARLRPCWPHHVGLLNDVRLLEWLYADGFGPQRRLLSAESFRRTLETVLERAERVTRTCPQPRSKHLHPVPIPLRDDTAQVELMQQQIQLPPALEHYVDANLEQHVENLTEEERHHRVAEHKEAMLAVIRTTGATTQEWKQYREQGQRQLEKRHILATSEGKTSER